MSVGHISPYKFECLQNQLYQSGISQILRNNSDTQLNAPDVFPQYNHITFDTTPIQISSDKPIIARQLIDNSNDAKKCVDNMNIIPLSYSTHYLSDSNDPHTPRKILTTHEHLQSSFSFESYYENNDRRLTPDANSSQSEKIMWDDQTPPKNTFIGHTQYLSDTLLSLLCDCFEHIDKNINDISKLANNVNKTKMVGQFDDEFKFVVAWLRGVIFDENKLLTHDTTAYEQRVIHKKFEYILITIMDICYDIINDSHITNLAQIVDIINKFTSSDTMVLENKK